MSLTPFDALWPEQPGQELRSLLNRKQRKLLSTIKRTQRNLIAASKRQYYLSDALSDSIKGFQLNQDIALAICILTVILTFSTVSILSNTIYTFLLTAGNLSGILGGGFVPLEFMAMIIILLSLCWVIALMQNSLALALMDGINRKQKRSLVSTLRRGLFAAAKTTNTWFVLLLLTFAPVGLLGIVTLGILYTAHVKLAGALPFLIIVGIISIGWIIKMLANFTLAPYVMLFENPKSLRQAMVRGRELIQSRGKIFAFSIYLALLIGLVSIYGLGILSQLIFGANSAITSLFLSVFVISTFNSGLTLFYRKRKLARK